MQYFVADTLYPLQTGGKDILDGGLKRRKAGREMARICGAVRVLITLAETRQIAALAP